MRILSGVQSSGNRTSTLTFLSKYYFLTKKGSLDHSIQLLNKLLDRIDIDKLSSAREQLKDV